MYRLIKIKEKNQRDQEKDNKIIYLKSIMVNEILNTENNIPKTQALLNQNIDSLISKAKKNIISVQGE